MLVLGTMHGSVSVVSDNFLALVITAAAAYSMCKLELAAVVTA